MISPEQVPQPAWLAMRDQMREGIRNEATLIAAALNAWPGKCTADGVMFPHIILPLPQENTDE